MVRIAWLIGAAAAWFAARGDAQTIVWEQSDFGTSSSVGASIFLPVADFNLAAPATINAFSVWLSDSSAVSGGDEIANGVFTSFSGTLSWYFFDDAGGLPGAMISSGAATSIDVVDTGIDRTASFIDDIFRVTGAIGPPVSFNAGTYWFGFREGSPGQAADGTDILWLVHNGVQGEFTKLFLDGQTPGQLSEAPNADNAFILYAVPEPAGMMWVLAAGAALMYRTWKRNESRSFPTAPHLQF